MQNWWYLYKPLGECVRSLKLDLQRKYMDFSLAHIIFSCADNAIFEFLFRVPCLYWKILYPIHLPFPTFHFMREMNCVFSILKTFLEENKNLHFQLPGLSSEIMDPERQPSVKKQICMSEMKTPIYTVSLSHLHCWYLIFPHEGRFQK